MRAHLAENLGDQVAHAAPTSSARPRAFRDRRRRWALAMTLSSQAGTLMLTDDLDGAETVLDEATELLEALNGSTGAGAVQLRLADIRLRRGDLAGARELRCAPSTDADLRATRAVVVRADVARIAWLDAATSTAPRALGATPPRGSSGSGSARPEQGHARPRRGARDDRRARGRRRRRGDADLAARRYATGVGDDRHADRRHGRRRRPPLSRSPAAPSRPPRASAPRASCAGPRTAPNPERSAAARGAARRVRAATGVRSRPTTRGRSR